MPIGDSIFHITHLDNVPGLIGRGGFDCDRTVSAFGGPTVVIGMSELKGRRFGIPVPMHSPLSVGDFVPFYFCPRSVMLYVIYCANHPDLAYKGGQDPIAHFRFDLDAVISWADDESQRWAFTLQNATSAYADFRASRYELELVNWNAVGSTSWSPPAIKDGKQAEFLVESFVPLSLVAEIGVKDINALDAVESMFDGSPFRPRVSVRRDWYY